MFRNAGQPSNAGHLPILVVVLLLLWAAGCSNTRPRGHFARSNAPSDAGSARLDWSSGVLPGLISRGSFSPGGQELAVELRPLANQTAQQPSPAHLWLVSHTTARPITHSPANTWHLDPQWDPTGPQIAYLTDVNLKRPEGPLAVPRLESGPDQIKIPRISTLKLLHRDTLGSRELLVLQGTLLSPRWSPDGALLACCATFVARDNVVGKVLLLHPTTNATKFYPLDESVHLTLLLAWSQDGSRLAIRADATRDAGLARELYLFDLASHSARRIYSTQAPWSLLDIGFDASDGTPVFVSCEMGALSKTAIESAVLYRCEVETKAAFEVARITAPKGWMIGAPELSPDGRGIAVTANELVQHASLPHQSAILWTHSGRNGSIPQPVRAFGTTDVLAWSNDSHCIAASYRDGEGSRLAVYRLPI